MYRGLEFLVDLAGLECPGWMPRRSGVHLSNISLVMTGPFGLGGRLFDCFGRPRLRFRFGLSGTGELVEGSDDEGSEEASGTEEGSDEAQREH